MLTTTAPMTVDELDALLAEQLPARELMTTSNHCCNSGDSYHGGETNQNNQFGLVNVSLLNQNADDGSNAQFIGIG